MGSCPHTHFATGARERFTAPFDEFLQEELRSPEGRRAWLEAALQEYEQDQGGEHLAHAVRTLLSVWEG